MNKFRIILAASVLSLLVLSGCQSQPAKSPEQVIQEGLSKLSSVTAYSYEVSAIGDLKGPKDTPPAVVKFDLNAKGGIDLKDPKDPRLNLTLAGNFNADADGGKGKFEMRLNKEAIFLNLGELVGQGSIAVPDEIKSQFVGKWWKLPIPPESLEEMAQSLPQGKTENLTPEQKKMKELVDQTKFFKDIKYVDNAKVMGEDSYHYTAVLDKAAFTEFVKKTAEINGESVSETEMKEMQKSFEMFDFSGDMYVGITSGILNKVKGTITIKGDETSPTGSVTIDLSAGDFDKAVTVTAPADAQAFPLDQLGMGASTAPVDDATAVDAASIGAPTDFATDELPTVVE
jgi:hypothetical protein